MKRSLFFLIAFPNYSMRYKQEVAEIYLTFNDLRLITIKNELHFLHFQR